MELKIGIYVRTPLGIAKYLGKAVSKNYITGETEQTDIDEFDQLDEELWSGDVANWVFECDMEHVVLKASHNIIDLIEAGDYVNGKYVYGTGYNTYDDFGVKIEKDLKYSQVIKEDDIKSIVTKEQFSAMEYKID